MRKRALLLMFTALAAAGCSTGTQTRYIHPNADLAAIKKVAVLPFDNVTQEKSAAEKVHKIVLVELLSLDVFDVVEPGQVAKVLRSEHIESTEALGDADLKKLGGLLNADALLLGSVVDFSEARTGSTPTPDVTIQLRLVETQTGKTIWTASQTRSGASVSNRLFGVGGESVTEAARSIVRAELRTLLK